MPEASAWAMRQARALWKPHWTTSMSERETTRAVDEIALALDEALAEGIKRGRKQAARELTDAAVSASLEAKDND